MTLARLTKKTIGFLTVCFFLVYALSFSIKASAYSNLSSGWIDYVGPNGIAGWVWQPAIPNTSIQAHIYIYTAGGNQVYGVACDANQYRSDLQAAGYGNGNHGFSTSINWGALPHGTLYIQIYSVDWSGANPMIYNSTYYNSSVPSSGVVDYVGMNEIAGWAWNSGMPNTPIQVRVNINDNLFSMVYDANQYRSDLQQAGIGNGYHAFFIKTNWFLFPREFLNVKVYALDSYGNSSKIYEGTYDNTTIINNVVNINQFTPFNMEQLGEKKLAGDCGPVSGVNMLKYWRDCRGVANLFLSDDEKTYKALCNAMQMTDLGVVPQMAYDGMLIYCNNNNKTRPSVFNKKYQDNDFNTITFNDFKNALNSNYVVSMIVPKGGSATHAILAVGYFYNDSGNYLRICDGYNNSTDNYFKFTTNPIVNVNQMFYYSW
jgi:hypothetical protein